MTAALSPPRYPTVAPPPAHQIRRHARVVDRSGWTVIYAFLPAAVMALVAYWQAGSREMGKDEYATYHASTISWGDLRLLFTHTDLLHAAYYAVMRGWVTVAGDSPLMLRAPSMAAMTVTALVVTLIGRRLVSTPVGVVAGLLLAITPAISRFAQEARPYALVTMLATVSTWLLLRALDEPTGVRFVLYAVSTALTGMINVLAFAVIGGQLLYVFLASRSHDELRRWRYAGALGAAFLVMLPVATLATKQSIAVPGATLGGFPGRLFLNDTLAYAMLLLALIGGLVLWRRHRSGAALLLGWALIPVLLAYLSYPLVHLLVAAYLLFTLPAFALLAAVTMCFLFRPLGREPHGALWSISAALLLPALAYVVMDDHRELRTGTVDGFPGYRSALAYVQEHARPGDGIVYNDRRGGRADLARSAAEYLWRDLAAAATPKDVLRSRTAAERGYFGAGECPDVAPCLSGRKRLWLVSTGTGKNYWSGMPAATQTILGQDFTAGEHRSWTGITVVLLTRRGS